LDYQLYRLALYGLSLLLFFITDWLQKFVKDSKEKWKFIAMTSMFGTFIPAFLFAIAQTEIDSSVTSILNSDAAKHLGFGCISFGVGFERRQVWGVLIGLLEAYF
jgi:drug/metabolite transporter (DMT)-like permease